MRFTNNAYHDIINTIGNKRAESGGLLFGYLEDYIVREFVFDKSAHTTVSSYTFNVNFLNEEIKRLWEEKQLACIGFIHSHPWSSKHPSYMDIQYFQEMFPQMPRDYYLVPIVNTIPDGGYDLSPCIIYPNSKQVITCDRVEIIQEEYKSKYMDLCSKHKYYYNYYDHNNSRSETQSYVNEDHPEEPAGDGSPIVCYPSSYFEEFKPPKLWQLVKDNLNELFKNPKSFRY